MNKKTLRALKGSINKWIKIVKGTGADHGEFNCPLCTLFNHIDSECVGCPVFEKTRKPFCQGTPYVGWLQVTHGTDRAETAVQKRAAQKMLAFLQRLLLSTELPSERE